MGAPQVADEHVQVGDLSLQVLRSGAGPRILLLHGDGESATDWRWVIPRLAREYEVVAPSLPGHGDSDKPRRVYDPDFFVEVLRGLLDATRTNQVAVVGNSFGGLLAIRLALREPERVRALCLVASSGLGPEVHPLVVLEAWPGVGELLVLTGRASVAARQRAHLRRLLMFAKSTRAPAAWVEEQARLPQLAGYWTATISARRTVFGLFGQRELVLDELGAVRVPTLIVWGAQDRVLPQRHAEAALQRLPNARLVVIPDCGHVPQIERPDLFLHHLLPFLAEVACG